MFLHLTYFDIYRPSKGKILYSSKSSN